MDNQALIIGAGPYGTGIAQELHHRGLGFRICGEPFALWLQHTLDSIKLRSDQNASEIYSRDGRYAFRHFKTQLNGKAPSNGRTPMVDGQVPVAIFRDYLHWVSDQLPFEVEPAQVEHLDFADEPRLLEDGALQQAHHPSFRARFDDGQEVTARAVVVATGMGPHQHFPPPLAALPTERVLHSWQTDRIQPLQGERLLVIGSGQSAAETVACLRRHGNEVTWAMREAPSFFGEPLRLPRPLFRLVLRGSAAYYRLPQPLRVWLGRTCFRTTVTPDLRPVFQDGAVRKIYGDAAELGLTAVEGGIICTAASAETGDERPFDRVIAATGYRCTVRGIPFLSDRLRDALGDPDQPPALDGAFQTVVPGLYMAGGISEGAFGPAQRFIFGSWQAAPRVGKSIAQLVST